MKEYKVIKEYRVEFIITEDTIILYTPNNPHLIKKEEYVEIDTKNKYWTTNRTTITHDFTKAIIEVLDNMDDFIQQYKEE